MKYLFGDIAKFMVQCAENVPLYKREEFQRMKECACHYEVHDGGRSNEFWIMNIPMFDVLGNIILQVVQRLLTCVICSRMVSLVRITTSAKNINEQKQLIIKIL